MNKIEFLAMSLPYGLKAKYTGIDSRFEFIIKNYGVDTDIQHNTVCIYNDDYTPIIRPVSALTEQCVQADYNGGEPFIPIAELLIKTDLFVDDDISFESGFEFIKSYIENNEYVAEFKPKGISWYKVLFKYDSFCFFVECYNFERLTTHIIPSQLPYFQQLIKWHFWPNMPENEQVIYVDDNFNPYK